MSFIVSEFSYWRHRGGTDFFATGCGVGPASSVFRRRRTGRGRAAPFRRGSRRVGHQTAPCRTDGTGAVRLPVLSPHAVVSGRIRDVRPGCARSFVPCRKDSVLSVQQPDPKRAEIAAPADPGWLRQSVFKNQVEGCDSSVHGEYGSKSVVRPSTGNLYAEIEFVLGIAEVQVLSTFA
jgi:hypothetical protein